MADLIGKLSRWISANSLSREEILASRWLKPFGKRIRQSDYWRFTRRSVPRGVAVGLFVGIFLMIPGLQIVGAVLLSMPLRANFPIAAAMTFLSNPLTTPFFLLAAINVGNWFGFHADMHTMAELIKHEAGWRDWLSWALSDAAPAMMLGLFMIAFFFGVIGYALSDWGWRWWVGRKWKARGYRGMPRL